MLSYKVTLISHTGHFCHSFHLDIEMRITQCANLSPAAAIDVTIKATSRREDLFWAYGPRGLESITAG